jgi:hypothetical protein
MILQRKKDLGHFSGIGHWLEDFANFSPTTEENDQQNANHS